MPAPVIAEVTRGTRVESLHRGIIAVVDADGGSVLSLGDVTRGVFPRSAVKGFQAIPLIESGAADRFGFSHAELSIACASHGGEPRHAALAESMLEKAGQTAACLECGLHWPLYDPAARALAAKGGEPTALHNNCSGKHAAFICASIAMGVDPKGYVTPEHPLQRAVIAATEDFCGIPLSEDMRAIDGCAIPTFAIPLHNIAHGFAKFATGKHIAPARAKAAQRLRQAVAAEPFMVAGTDRADTKIMEIFGERAFIKMGAEGVHCAALPDVGLGIAIKVDDGATRAAELAVATLLARFLPLTDQEAAVLDRYQHQKIYNRNGALVGEVRAGEAIRPA